MTKWLDIAWAEVGVQETSGSDATPDIIAYFRDAGRADITSDEVAWCAAFVGACLERAGIAQSIEPAAALLARSYLSVGTDTGGALRMGAIVVLTRGSDPRQGHVGFCVGWTDAHVVLLGGNQANKVCTQHFARSRIIGVRWPELKTARDVKRDGSRIVKAASRQKRDAAITVSAPNMPAPVNAEPAAFPTPDALAGKATALQGHVEALASFAAFVGARWPWIMAGIAFYFGARMAWDAWQIRSWRVEDAATGKTVMTGGDSG